MLGQMHLDGKALKANTLLGKKTYNKNFFWFLY
jgi:hypothetical protein